MPTFSLEQHYAGQGPVAGVDEVGYGAWAGPVVVAAVILHPLQLPQELLTVIKDSKKLTPTVRTQVAQAFQDNPLYGRYSLAYATVEDITQHNVLRATLKAMHEALEELQPAVALIDGKHLPPPGAWTSHSILGGDTLSYSIAMASIVAKVHRDALMTQLSQGFPAFAWHSNKGYGTAAHNDALKHHGLTLHHRHTYKPLQKLMVAKAGVI